MSKPGPTKDNAERVYRYDIFCMACHKIFSIFIAKKVGTTHWIESYGYCPMCNYINHLQKQMGGRTK